MNCQICHRFTDYRIILFVILDSFLFVTGISFQNISPARHIYSGVAGG
ncbi:MAG: hypothetical protein KJ666_08225 [Bacteroidetes bacterium]|nr:hypothetical protein [Bacteroidota bacterium]MBU2585366.1 hypothetical protein [Bacteroidota bacterium]